jgi:chromosome partitioning protein
MNIIALVNQKGGVGKSTLATALGVELTVRGSRVLLGDADPQASTQGWAALAANAGSPMPVVVGLGDGFHRPGQLDSLANGYDFVLIDCPPHSGPIMRAALAVCDLALMPVVAGAFDAWALGDSLELVEQARMIRPELRAAVVLNRATKRRAETARQMLANCGAFVLETWLGQRVDMSDAVAAGQGPTTYAPRGKAAGELRAVCDELLEMLGVTTRLAKAV